MLVGALVWAVFLVVILLVTSSWRLLVKAGRPGWPAVVPVYSGVALLRVAGKPGWWLLLYLVPVLNLLVHWQVCVDLARKFSKSGGFAAGLFFLPPVFWPILADGDHRYEGLAAPPASRPATLLAFLIYFTLSGLVGLLRTDPLSLFVLNLVALACLIVLWCKRKWGGYAFLACSAGALVWGLSTTHQLFHPGLEILLPLGLLQGGILALFAWTLSRA